MLLKDAGGSAISIGGLSDARNQRNEQREQTYVSFLYCIRVMRTENYEEYSVRGGVVLVMFSNLPILSVPTISPNYAHFKRAIPVALNHVVK
jgi:hypothetical protein